MSEKPAFIQGLYSFEGRGLASPGPAQRRPSPTWSPFAKRAQLIYFRAGNPSAEMIYVVLMRRGQPLRYFPIGAKSAVHVPLAVVEDLDPETQDGGARSERRKA